MKIIGKNGYIGSLLGEVSGEGTILLAGHSSVQMCHNDPQGAWVNNVEYFRSVLETQATPLIYASSATVYDSVKNPNEDTNEFHLKNMYDLTKRTIDNLAELSDKPTYGLRFATVCGWSPNLRVDVMLNKMYYDGKTTGKITVVNPQIERPILGIEDCVRAIRYIADNKPEAGIYNLASFTASVEDMAYYVADKTGATVEIKDGLPTYAYGVDTSKIRETGFVFKETLESVVDSLINNKIERTRICA